MLLQAAARVARQRGLTAATQGPRDGDKSAGVRVRAWRKDVSVPGR